MIILSDYVHWNPDPILFDFGFLQLKAYGVLFVTGFVLGYFFFRREAVRQSIPVAKLDTLLFLVLGFSILGARMAHVFFYDWSLYKHNPGSMLKIWEGGLASHGGGIGMVMGAWIWCRFVAKTSFWRVVDLMAVPTPLAGAFIRLGNLWNSEILGKPAEVSWAFIFESRDAVPRHPVQLYEAACYVAGSGILYLLYRKFGLRYKGLLTAAFLLVIFIPRFLLEFFKEPQENYDLGIPLNTGQILSLPFIIIATAYLIWKLRVRITAADV
jgi:phosphatidylglycerol:prolipoprotein diacylglycerol transferase